MAGPPALSRRVFEKYDKDESGTIDRNEFKAMCYDLGYYLSEAETDIAFRTIDLSGNGDITYDEFYQARTHTRTRRTHRTRTRTHRTRLTMSV
jgi:Ca2+-binding EF-hand superfamily protein